MSQINDLDALIAQHTDGYPENVELARRFYALGWNAAMRAKTRDNAEEIANHAYEPDSMGV